MKARNGGGPSGTACPEGGDPLDCPSDGAGGGDDGGAGTEGEGEGEGEGEACVPHPIGQEICNDADDDCDGTVDEGFDLMTNPLHCGVCNNSCESDTEELVCDNARCVKTGCRVGFHDVDEDPDNGCEYPCHVAGDGVERCNDNDDDCDGLVDEAGGDDPDEVLSRACYGGPEGTAGVGICEEGAHLCVDGAFQPCVGEVRPRAETCDGVDEDCDGEVDEDLGVGEVCSAGVGACARGGLTECDDEGGVVCNAVAAEGGDEICDGLDNDCDGEVDEDLGLGEECEDGDGDCRQAGRMVCGPNGSVVCDAVAGDGGEELCDGRDNDCDGEADEDLGLGGPCEVGQGECVRIGALDCDGEGGVACVGDPGQPQDEVCDHLDNDCDGQVDEEIDCGCAPPERSRCVITPGPAQQEGCHEDHFSINSLARGRARVDVTMGECTELRLDIEFCNPRNWVLNVGDSHSNNGGSGDGGHSSNDAEIEVNGTNFAVQGNDFGPGPPTLLSSANWIEANGCTSRTIVVRDGEVLTDVAGVELESPFSLRLNPPEDREGQPDDRWYVGINRVVANEGRTGSGVDSATLTVR